MSTPIIVGYRRKPKLIASFRYDCPQCGKKTIHVHSEVSENPTLYSISIPIGSRWTSVQCSKCGLARRVAKENEEEIRSLAEYGAAPFRICPKCVAHNDLDATFCRVCDEPLKSLLFPRKTGAQILAILLTALFGLFFVMLCYSTVNLTTGKTATAHNQHGVELFKQGELDEAIQEFQEAIRLRPDLAVAHSNLGWAYYHQSDPDQAIEAFQEAIRLDPDMAEAHQGLGWAYMGRAEFEEAVEQFETLIELQPDWGAPHAWLASVYYQLDQLDLMEQEMQNALALQAEDALTSYALGTAYGNLGRFSEAEAQLLKAIELSPDAEDFYIGLAYVYSAQREFDLALQMCGRALELHENYANAYAERSRVYVYQENLDQALEELSQALKIAPEDEVIHNYLSFVYFNNGQMSEALKEAEEAVRLQPYGASGHTNLAFAYHVQGELDLALAAAQESVRLAPKYDRAHYILGLCYMDKGENEKAVAEFEKFLDLYWDRAYVRDYKVKAEAYLAQLQEVIPKEEATTTAAVPPTTPLAPSASSDMVYILAGEFIMGSSDAEVVDYALALCSEYRGCERSWYDDEQPQHTVYLDAFYIDKTEVTNAQYRACVEAGACQAPTTCDDGQPTYEDASKTDHPVVCVDWDDAQAYCAWAEKRLPTEAEWEKAARGTDGRVYPWGNTFDGSKLNFCDKNCSADWRDASIDDGYARTAPVGSFPAGASPYGALDMAGNVGEWVADWLDSGYYSRSPGRNPPGPDSGEKRVLRGGAYFLDPSDVRSAVRGRTDPDYRFNYGGFRCARGSE